MRQYNSLLPFRYSAKWEEILLWPWPEQPDWLHWPHLNMLYHTCIVHHSKEELDQPRKLVIFNTDIYTLMLWLHHHKVDIKYPYDIKRIVICWMSLLFNSLLVLCGYHKGYPYLKVARLLHREEVWWNQQTITVFEVVWWVTKNPQNCCRNNPAVRNPNNPAVVTTIIVIDA